MQDYEQHPLSVMFPPMAKDAFRNLCADIAANGVQFAIILFGGMILDGWHRYLACKQVGIEPVFEEFEGDLAAARKYVISANHHRRHAKPAQIAMTAAEFATLPHGGHRGTAEEQKVALKPMTVAEASKVFGVNTRYIKMARLVLRSGDNDLIAEVKDCRKQLADAAREVQSRRSKPERVKKAQRSDKPPPASEPGENTLEPGDGLNGGGAEDEGITGELVDAAPAPEGAAEKSTAIEEAAEYPIEHADVRSQRSRAGNDSTDELAGSRAASAAVRAEPPQTSAPENNTVELECASNHAAEEPVSAPRPAKGAGDGPEPAPEPVTSAIEAAASLSLARGEGDDPAIDEPVDPPLLVQQAGEELGTVVEFGTGWNHSKAADADHSTGDPGGAPSSEVKIRRVAVEKKKRKTQHPELFPEEPLPAPLDAKQSNEKGDRSDETKDEEPVPLNGMTDCSAAAKVASDETRRKLFAEYHARRLRRHDRYRHLRIGRSVRSLARIRVPRADNLNKVLSRQFQAAIREDIPKALAALQAWAEVINSSLTEDE